ncbi:MAG TPA: S49 family peptidase, partial [Xanthobacteraceae bacterium]
LDPFLPENPDDVERLKALQKDIHQGFIDLVKQSRGSRLKGPEQTLFSGEYWTGPKAIELGLADGIGDLRQTLKERFGDKVMTPLISPERSLFGRARPRIDLQGLGSPGLDLMSRDFMSHDFVSHGAELAGGIISALEARALWARYGL